jgi:hypothetical protein
MLRERNIAGYGQTGRRSAASLTRIALLCIGFACAAVLPSPRSAAAAIAIEQLDSTFTRADGLPATQAGSHPFAWTTDLILNTSSASDAAPPRRNLRDLRISLPPGVAGTPGTFPHCPRSAFIDGDCPADSLVGDLQLSTSNAVTDGIVFPVYNLVPLPGSAAELGFVALATPVPMKVEMNPQPPYNLIVSIAGIPRVAVIFGAKLTIHGVSGPAAFLTLPRSCPGPPSLEVEVDSWQEPGIWVGSQPEEPLFFTGCGSLPFAPTLTAEPTTAMARSPSGLDLSLDIADGGLTSAAGIAQADLAKAVLTFPPGTTINPGAAEGLGACAVAELAADAGCPPASRIGSVEVTTPLLQKPLDGGIYVGRPDDPATAAAGAENPFDSLFALYLVLEDPERDIHIEQPVAVEADPRTGRLTATVEGIPQLPFAHLDLRLKAGPRAPLTMPGCGDSAIDYRLTPSSGRQPLSARASFGASRGCASPPFAPAVSAGTANPRAGASSPFVFDLSSAQGGQNLSSLSLILPPGLTADFAAVPSCPEELAVSGHCPPGTKIGYARIATGPGPSPLWIPESGRTPSAVYLAGPYEGAPFSLVVVVPAEVGPFDLGTVITRAAIFVDRETAQATIRLDPLPQTLEGVPVSYRTVRLVLDRQGFVDNPTSCAATAVTASVTSTAGTVAAASDRFQAGDCAALGFRPRAAVRLLGPARRGAHPRLRAVLAPRAGDANLRRAEVTVPGAELLDSRHIEAVCSAELFAGGRCPAGSVYGRVKVFTPLLRDPLEGPVYLRASDGSLPDLAASLEGQIHLDLTARLSSAGGRLQVALQRLPDVPFSKVVLTMNGGRRGLLVNTGGLCSRRWRARIGFLAQSGKRRQAYPVVRTDCAGAPRGS